MEYNQLTHTEVKNRRIGWIVTIIVHLILLIAFWLYNIWPFNPPLESLYGIQVNFGTSQVGSGEVQNEPTSQESTATEQMSESESEPENESEPASNSEVESFDTESEVTNDAETVETENTTNTETNTTTETETTPTETDNTTEQETTEETESQEETSNTTENSNSDQNENNETSNEGNDLYPGDKGSEQGEINESDIYKGSSTGKGGFNSNISGWAPDFMPNPQDDSNESGKIVFKIKIDEDGEIVSVILVESSVSARVAQIYQQEVEKLSFHTTSNNPHPAPFSTGEVSFIIRSH